MRAELSAASALTVDGSESRVRQQLHRWQDEPYVRELDDRLFGWETMLTAIRS